MENIDDKGRMGKEYKPFPVKYKSKYVPNKLPSKIDIMRGRILFNPKWKWLFW